MFGCTRSAAASSTSRAALPRPQVTDRCTGCGRCVAACPPHVLWLDSRDGRKTAVLHDAAGCTGCSRCEPVCPFGAIRMVR